MEVSLKKSWVSLSGKGHTSSYLGSLSANVTLRHSFIDYNTIQKAIAYGVATKIGHVPALYPKFITAGLRRNKENLCRVAWIGER
jgi:hypothetical protein